MPDYVISPPSSMFFNPHNVFIISSAHALSAWCVVSKLLVRLYAAFQALGDQDKLQGAVNCSRQCAYNGTNIVHLAFAKFDESTFYDIIPYLWKYLSWRQITCRGWDYGFVCKKREKAMVTPKNSIPFERITRVFYGEKDLWLGFRLVSSSSTASLGRPLKTSRC